MAGTIYIRQSSFADGDTITAALFNNEFNQLANAFAYTTSGTTGHTHDGTDGQGGNVSKIGDQDFKNKIVVDSTNNRWGIFVEVAGVTTEQVRIQDGAFVPVVDSDINLGSPTAYFKDSYIDTVTTTGAVTVGGALSAASFAIGGTALTATITELNTLDGITSTVTELNYTDGVTSNIQTQLNAKQPLDAQLTDIAALTPTDGTFIVGDGTNFVAEAPATALASLGVTSTATELNVLDGITTTTAELNYVHNVTSPIQTQLNAKQALNAKLTDISNLTLADNFFLVSTGSNLALESPAAALTSLGVTATATELNYVDGVTSNVQTQLDTKSPLSSPTFTGTLTAPIINASSDLKIGGTTIAATATELNYLSGVTSSVQTQLDALQASDTDLSAIAALTPSDGNFIVGNGTSWVAESGNTVIASLGVTATATELNYTDGVTSSIQTQLDTKAPLASPTFTGTVTIPAATVTGDVSFGDNNKAIFGNSNDLQIYHDGSNSIIYEGGTGDLQLRGNGGSTTIMNGGGTETLANFGNNGAVTLYHDNAQKLATTSTGIDVTGTAIMDGLTVDGDVEISATRPILDLMCTGATDENTRIDVNLGNLRVRTLNDAKTTAKERVSIDNATGDISFYEDTGTTAKFFWDASSESLGVGNNSPQQVLHISQGASAGTTALRIENTESGIDASQVANAIEFYTNDASAGGTGVTGKISHVAVNAGTTYALALSTYNSTDLLERLRIDANGDISFYEDTGTTPKFFWDASAESLGIGGLPSFAAYEARGNDYSFRGFDATGGFGLQISHDGSAGISKLSQTNSTGDLMLEGGTSTGLLLFNTGGAEAMRIDSSGALLLHPNSPTRGLKITSTQTVAVGDTETYNAIGAGYGQHIFQTDSIERMRIDSSGNVGIGVVPSNLQSTRTTFEIGSDSSRTGNGLTQPAAASYIQLNSNTEYNASGTALYANTVPAATYVQYNGEHIWNTAASGTAGTTIAFSEAMRIDSSGNLLVGHTGSVYNNVNVTSTEGISLTTNGEIFACSSESSGVMILNRKSTDGAIASFRKDGTTVGSIGVADSGDRIYLGGSGTNRGIAIDSSASVVIPSTNTGGLADTLIGLGTSSARWTNLYLSGGVYLGGTGAANLLDDYEEGSWTPALSNVTSTVTTATGNYTKIGRVVFFKVYLSVSSLDNADTSGLFVTLPFASSGADALMTMDTALSTLIGSANQPLVLGAYASGSGIIFTKASTSFLYNQMNSSGVLVFSGQFRAT